MSSSAPGVEEDPCATGTISVYDPDKVVDARDSAAPHVSEEDRGRERGSESRTSRGGRGGRRLRAEEEVALLHLHAPASAPATEGTEMSDIFEDISKVFLLYLNVLLAD